jgi:hypothetical protein
MIAGLFAGEITRLAIVRAVGRWREEIALLRFLRREHVAKETFRLVNIIFLIGLNAKTKLWDSADFLWISRAYLSWLERGPARTALGWWGC